MIPFFKSNKKVDNFKAEKLIESTEKLNNPMRGWYSIYYFVLREGNDFDLLEGRINTSDSLAMAFIDIAALGKESLTEGDVEEIRTILNFFKNHDKDLILRFAYDHEGHGMEREPLSFAIIEKHAKALTEIVNEYDNIFVLQGLLVGNWGEMHSSRFMKDEYLARIATIYSRCNKVYFAVRKPVHWRNLNKFYSKNNTETFEKIGIFDDAIFASETDLGTFSNKKKAEYGYQSEWLRSEEMEFLDNLGKKYPFGGEVIYGEGYSDSISVNQIKDDMTRMHLTYLNSEYDKKVLDKWKTMPSLGNGVWAEASLYDYVDAHLAYRFFIDKCSVRKDKEGNIIVEISVKNTGFAPIYKEADVYLEIDNDGLVESHKIRGGLNGIFTNEARLLSASFKVNKGNIRAYGKMGDKIILFANVNAKDKVELGRLE